MNQEATATIRTAVIGTGLMGQRMLGSLARHSEFEVVSAFDLDEHSLASAQQQFQFEAAGDVSELLARKDLDLVYVATPPNSHIALARRTLEQGLPLFLEKPLATDVESARSLVEWASASPVPVALNFPFASLGLSQYIDAQRSSGQSGKPLRVDVQLHFSQWPRTWHKAGDWLAGDDEGGFLREVFSHFAYLTQSVLGPMKVLNSRLTQSVGRGETRIVADLLAGDVPISLVGGVGGAAPDYNRWTLYCESESYALEDWSKLFSTDAKSPWTELSSDQLAATHPGMQLDQLAGFLRGHDSALPTLREGLQVLETVEHLLRC